MKRIILTALEGLRWLVSLGYPAALILAESGTCAEGDLWEYRLALIMALAASAGFALLTAVVRRLGGPRFSVGWIHLPTLVPFFLMIPRDLWFTTIRGFALCHGNTEWGGFLGVPNGELVRASLPFEYLFAPLLILAFLPIALIAARELRQALRKG